MNPRQRHIAVCQSRITALDIRRLAIMVRDYRAACRRLSFFDAAAWIGRPATPEFECRNTATAVLKLMQQVSIRRAIVTHTAAVDLDPVTGNELLFRAIRCHPALQGAVVLLPEGTGEMRPITQYLDRCLRRKARLVRLFPKLHNFSLAHWCSGTLLKALEERRVPLVIWHSETSWDQLRAIAQDYPALPIILEGTEGSGRKIMYYNRLYYPLMRECPNLYLSLHYIYNYLLIEDLVATFGAERLLFSSYLPRHDPNAALMKITHALIPERDKALIAGHNLERLLKGILL